MNVKKRTVEVFEVGEQRLEREQALGLYRSLAEALGVPAFEHQGCDGRLSHGAHWHGTSQRLYCRGLSFDRT